MLQRMQRDPFNLQRLCLFCGDGVVYFIHLFFLQKQLVRTPAVLATGSDLYSLFLSIRKNT
uniref:Uncharacterized protein n=1 Tax=Anguilla anguilla TaxID=7936 RepID=A0A0E9SAS3_ANGAN